LFLTALAVFGLVFGSFANVVIWRLPRGESLSHPDSHCPVCEAPIIWRDNVPVLSWLALRGRCRACGVPISPRYPVVELISGMLWLGAGLRFGMTLQTAAAIAFFYLLMILAYVDFDTMRLPNVLVGLLALIGLLGAAVSQFLRIPAVPLLSSGGIFGDAPLVSAFAGALVCALPALALAVVMSAVLKRPALGMGDVKLLGVIGVFLGAYGLLAFFVGSLFGAVYGVVSHRSLAVQAGEGDERSPAGASARVDSVVDDDSYDEGDGYADDGEDDSVAEAAPEPQRQGTPFPFGPALVIGAIIVTMVGPQMWSWYQSLFGL